MPSHPIEREPVIQPQDQTIRLIPLTQGHVVIVDAIDYECLSQWPWHVRTNKAGQSYAVRHALASENGPRTILMHRVILNSPKGRKVDHVNRCETLDNRRSNLRIADNFQSAWNRGPRSNNRSGYKGVCSRGDKWLAQLRIKGRTVLRKEFTTKEAAALAYNDAAKHYHGKFACLNDVKQP